MNSQLAAWAIRLTATAEADFRQIVRWSALQCGNRQARIYATTLRSALQALADGPHIAGVRKRQDIGKGVLTLHVARGGRKGRHLVLFRARDEQGQRHIEVLRLLHDSMDLPNFLHSATPGLERVDRPALKISHDSTSTVG